MKLSEKIRACDFRAPAEVPDYEYGATKDYSSIKFYSIDTNEVLHLASQVAELEADLKKLRTDFCAVVSEREQASAALAEIREVWAGSEGGEPVTCQEAYFKRLAQQCYEIAVEALK